MSRRTRKNINIAVVGAEGRMGSAIVRLLRRGKKIGKIWKLEANSTWPEASDVDVVIEFSSPEGLRLTLDWCLRFRKPMVTGTTGLKPSDWKKLKLASQKIPVLYSANMSLGIAVMKAMMRSFAAIKDWRYLMEETHHKKKKDKPSGTAKMLAESLLQTIGKRPLKIVSHRRGLVPGTHEIFALGPEETLVLRHIAHDRQVFARGAIAAALWLFDKGKSGLYDIGDLYQGR